MRVRDGVLVPSIADRLLLWPSYRGKLRIAAAAYGRLRYQGAAETPLGRLHVDTGHHEDWAALFGGMEQREVRWAANESRGAALVFDLGAHHGVFSLALARAADNLVAVEPFPESAAILRGDGR